MVNITKPGALFNVSMGACAKGMLCAYAAKLQVIPTASSAFEVRKLFRDDVLIEIEAIAAVPI